MSLGTITNKIGYVLVITISALLSQTTHAQTQMMYWVNDGNVYRANTDGTAKQLIYDRSQRGEHVGFIDDDPLTNKLYLYSKNLTTSTSYIKSMNYDGSGLATVIDSGLSSIRYGFDVDDINRKLYIGSHGAGPAAGMRWANIDGTGLEVIPPDPYYAHDIEVDTVHNKLYWTDSVQFNGIRRSYLDGTGQENVWAGGGDLSHHIALDPENNLIYFTDSRNKKICRINMDGTNEIVLLTGVAAEDIELDPVNDRLYWASQTKIQRAYLNGMGVEDLIDLAVTGHGAGDSLVLVTVPEPATLALIGLGWLTVRKRR